MFPHPSFIILLKGLHTRYRVPFKFLLAYLPSTKPISAVSLYVGHRLNKLLHEVTLIELLTCFSAATLCLWPGTFAVHFSNCIPERLLPVGVLEYPFSGSLVSSWWLSSHWPFLGHSCLTHCIAVISINVCVCFQEMCW